MVCSQTLLRRRRGQKEIVTDPEKANVSDTCKHVHVQYVLIVYMYIYMLLLLFYVTEYVHMYIMICLMHYINWAMQSLYTVLYFSV